MKPCVWPPVLGKNLPLNVNMETQKYQYAVSVIKVVEHIPRELSKTCSSFIARESEIRCIAKEVGNVLRYWMVD